MNQPSGVRHPAPHFLVQFRCHCEPVHTLAWQSPATAPQQKAFPWGQLLSCTGSMASTLGQLNPLRYRGYVYDSETGLYYLQSRYYDPALRRFINADAYTSTGQGFIGNNMFAYCLNNPVNCTDSIGTRCVAVAALRHGGSLEPPKPQWIHDGNEKSEDLLDLMQTMFEDISKLDNFRCSVSYDGIVSKTTDTSLQWAKLILDGVTMCIPGKVATGISAAIFIYDTYELIKGPDLPDKDYYQFTVSVSWDQKFTVDEGIVIEHYAYDLVYVWNDTHYESPSWYLIKVIDNTHTERLF